MPNNLASKIKAFGSPMMMGLVAQAAPSVLKGIILEYLQDIKIRDLQIFVDENKSLWGMLTLEYQIKIKNLTSRIKDVRWLTADWLISSSRERISKIRDDRPDHQAERAKLCALISYFLSSKRAYAWLENQALIIRQELSAKN